MVSTLLGFPFLPPPAFDPPQSLTRYEQPAPRAPDGALSDRAERHPARAHPRSSLQELVWVDGLPRGLSHQ